MPHSATNFRGPQIFISLDFSTIQHSCQHYCRPVQWCENYLGYCPNIFLCLHQFWSIYLNTCVKCIILANVNSRPRSQHVIVRLSVCRLPVCLSSVTFLHPTQAIKIFHNVSMPCGTLAIHDPWIKILRSSSQRTPQSGELKHSRIWRFWTYRKLYLGKRAR